MKLHIAAPAPLVHVEHAEQATPGEHAAPAALNHEHHILPRAGRARGLRAFRFLKLRRASMPFTQPARP